MVRRLIVMVLSMAVAVLGMLGLGAVPAAAAAPQTVADEPTGGGNIYSMAVSNGITYVGGSFSAVGAATGGGGQTALADGSVMRTMPPVAGNVYAAVADGSGGWFIAGDFTSVGGVARNGLAHITSTGLVDPQWNPSVAGAQAYVNTLALSGSTLYVGGNFTSIGGVERSSAAAVSTSDGSVTSWNPRVRIDYWNTGYVFRMIVSATAVYLGGYFNELGTTPDYRRNLAAVNLTDGAATAWDPSPDNNVTAMHLSGSTLYVGGNFSNVGTTPAARTRLAAINTSTGDVTSWAPSSDSQVDALAQVGTNIYVGSNGTISSGANSRSYIAKVNATTGAIQTWNAQADGAVTALAVNGTTLYAGGNFGSMLGTPATRTAALSTGTNAVLQAWRPGADGSVTALAVSGSNIYLGGNFRHTNLRERSNAAAFDANGVLTAWNPAPNNYVNHLKTFGATVYLAGPFDVAGGQSRYRMAAVDASSGVATAWNPQMDWQFAYYSTDIVPTAAAVFVASTQTGFVGGEYRQYLAAVNTTDGAVTSWAPQPDNAVYQLDASGGTVYASGAFGTIGGQSVTGLASLDASTGAANPSWMPNPNGEIRDMMVSGSTLFAAGDFTAIGGANRNYIAGVSTATGAATGFNPNANGSVYSLTSIGSTIYFNGGFSQVGGVGRNYLAAANATTGALSNWNVALSSNSSTSVIAANGSTLMVGGMAYYPGGPFFDSGGLRGSFGRGDGNYYGVALAAVSSMVPPRPSGAEVANGKASWAPPLFNGVQYYLVSYRPVGQARWGLYAFGGAGEGINLNNPDVATCSDENIALGYGECPMYWGWNSGTTYEFALTARSNWNVNSAGPPQVAFTYTAP